MQIYRVWILFFNWPPFDKRKNIWIASCFCRQRELNPRSRRVHYPALHCLSIKRHGYRLIDTESSWCGDCSSSSIWMILEMGSNFIAGVRGGWGVCHKMHRDFTSMVFVFSRNQLKVLAAFSGTTSAFPRRSRGSRSATPTPWGTGPSSSESSFTWPARSQRLTTRSFSTK